MNKIEFIKDNWENNWEDKASTLNWIHKEGGVQHPEFNGRTTHCRSFLYTLIKILKPKNILEIGSWHYDGANIMGLAMKDFNIDGKIISIDIRKGGYDGQENSAKILYDNISGIYWYPHHTSYDNWKYSVNDIVYNEFKNMSNDDIFTKNIDILKQVAPDKGFDLIMIDGDHSFDGVNFDWEYSKIFSHDDTIFIFDDLFDTRHYQVRNFWDNLNTYKYDFIDWNRKFPQYLISDGVTLKK